MENNVKSFSLFKIFLLAITTLAVISVVVFSGKLIERNDFGYYRVKQAFISGTMSIRQTPGMYGQMLGRIEPYKISDAIYLSADNLDGGSGKAVQSVKVQFPDGYAHVDIVAQYELSTDEKDQYALHKKYSSNSAVKSMIRQQLLEVAKATGPLFNSGDAYADKRPNFIQAIQTQCTDGIYAAHVETRTIINKDKTTRTEKRYSIETWLDTSGVIPLERPVVQKKSVLALYGIKIIQLNVKEMKFDEKLMALIDARKMAQKAEQDAITAKAEGDALIAGERATQEAIKIKAVTIANKEKEVGVLNAQREKEVGVLNAERELDIMALQAKQALEEKKKKIATAEGIAKELEIADGLSVREKYQIDANVKRDIGVAEYMSQWVGPQIVMAGGSGDGSQGSGIEKALMIQMMSNMVKSKTK